MSVLRNECGITPFWNPASRDPEPQIEKFIAIWDTGATNSVINQAVVDRCGLVPTGMAQVYHAQGSARAETYLVNIALPNGLVLVGVKVTRGDLTGGDILIGMDVISQGDFAVTNFDGWTKFSFRTPSMEHIDFVEPINKANTAKAQPQNRAERRRAQKGRE